MIKVIDTQLRAKIMNNLMRVNGENKKHQGSIMI